MICTRDLTIIAAAGMAAICSASVPAHALTVEPTSRDERMAAAPAVCSGKVTGLTCFRKPGSDAIYTRAAIEVIEPVKGELPSTFDLVYPGGELGDVQLDCSGMPDLAPGAVRTFCLEPADNGSFTPYGGRIGIWPVTAPLLSELGLPADGLLVPNRRHTIVDRGEPIGVIADVSTRPAGITEAQALTALTNAMASWEAHTYVTFEFIGTEVFTQSVTTINDRSLLIRVQMHDNFNDISDSGITVGIGGTYFSPTDLTGGEFLGRSFRSVSTSYIVVNHPKSSLSDPTNLEEVLAHEFGHTLGLSHSSETESETNVLLNDALMFYLAHKDGRGADPRTWDIDAVRRCYPTNNTPPYSYHRYLTAVTSPFGNLAHPEVNIVHLVDDDLDGGALSIDVREATTNNGTWSLNGQAVTYTPSGWISDSTAPDPLSEFFDRYRYRIYDGAYYSASYDVRVIAFRMDSSPYPVPDGLPDTWMTEHFGTTVAVAGTSAPSDDVDNDSLTTLEEFLLGSAPTNANSGMAVDTLAIQGGEASIEWGALPYSVYELQESLDDGATWTNTHYLQSLDPAPGVQTNTIRIAPKALYRIRTRH